MIYGERPGQSFEQDSKGLIAKRVIRCDWADVDPAPIAGLPHMGDSWSAFLPFLRVVHIFADDPGTGLCDYTVQYSTQRCLGDEFYETSLDLGLEQIDCTKGYVWETAGTPVTTEIPTLVPVILYSVRIKEDIAEINNIVAATNKINSKIFHGFLVEQMRFDGAGTDNSYDLNGNIISVQSVYKFTIKDMSHRQAWREPLQARESSKNGGGLIFWHDVPDEDFYTTDITKVGTPVWMNQVPGYESAISGTGGWDKPMNGSAYRYELCDFADVLGLPLQPGDG